VLRLQIQLHRRCSSSFWGCCYQIFKVLRLFHFNGRAHHTAPTPNHCIKIGQGSLMQNIPINMCKKFHYDRLRNDRALGNRKSDNNKNNNNNNNNVRSHWGPVNTSHHMCRIWRTTLFGPGNGSPSATDVDFVVVLVVVVIIFSKY